MIASALDLAMAPKIDTHGTVAEAQLDAWK